MRKILLLLLIPMVALADPSPKSKQLKIGVFAQGDGTTLVNPAYYTMVAQRYAIACGGSYVSPTAQAAVLAINPTFKPYTYNLLGRPWNDTTGATIGCGSSLNWLNDTLALKTWAAARGINSDSIFLRATSMVIIASRELGCVSGSQVDQVKYDTTFTGGIIHYRHYRAYETRYLFNEKNPNYGAWVYYAWKNNQGYNGNSEAGVAYIGSMGMFLDEEGTWKSTTLTQYGDMPMWPLRDSTDPGGEGHWWVLGYNSVTPNLLASVASPVTHIKARDSASVWRRYWGGALRDSMHAHGYLMLSNPASTYGHSLPNQWDFEYKQASIDLGGVIFGEYSFIYPGYNTAMNNGYIQNTRRYVSELAPYNVDVNVAWIRVGGYELNEGKSLDRSQMSFLGMALDYTFPGNANVFFTPNQNLGQVGQYPGYEPVATIPDTLAFWNDAWGKYFGVPSATRTEAVVGTDGAGNPNRIRSFFLDRPDNGQHLTLVAGRYAEGNAVYDSNSTRTSFTLPASPTGTWWELQSLGRARGVSNVGYKRSKNSGDTVWLANSYFRVFSSDTVMSNTGVAGPPTPTGACCIVTSCSITTQAVCVASGGTYQGDNTTCSPTNPCNAVITPQGACCLNNVCSITTQANCAGYWQGANTTCNPSYLCGFPSTADTTKKQVINGQIIINGQVILK